MLDILSPKGRESLEHEMRMLEKLRESYPDFAFLYTDKKEPSAIDGFVFRGRTKELVGIYESKCRNMTSDQLINQFDNEWLITYEKITQGSVLSRMLRTPFFGFLYLIPEDMVIRVQITDTDGNIIVPVRLAVTSSQATCNGGTARRTNAYIKLP